MIRLLKLPYWILCLITQAKSFKGNPIIGSRTLNLLGLHAARVIWAKASARLRWTFLAPMMPKALRQEYQKNGFVVVKNFISAADVIALRADIRAYDGPARQLTQGDTSTQRFLLDNSALSSLPHLANLAGNSQLKRYLNYTGAKIAAPLLYVQRIRNGYKKGGADPQKNIHSDTFHPTMKAWLFLDNVTEARGPFTYVPGSNRLTLKRLKWEYTRSTHAATMTDRYSEKGSMRASMADLAAMGLPAPKGITATAGTLVIANTNGFHGRGQAQSGASRLEIWAYSRHNPFNPFPGIHLPFARALKNTAMQFFWRHNDRKAATQNKHPSWRLIDASTMTDGLSGNTTPSQNLP